MKNSRNLFFFIFLFSGLGLFAQDIHFSQFYMSPLNLNPAMTGVMDCNRRISINYRNQWASILKNNAFNTASISYDQKVPVGRSDYFGVGGTVWFDQAGSAGFQSFTGKLSGSYAKKLGGGRKRSNYLIAGGEVGYANRSINQAELRWGSQFVNGEFDRNANGEVIDNPSISFLDLAAGLLWFTVLDDNKNFYIGASYAHLNQPNLSFFENGDEPKFSRLTAHAGAELPLGRSMVIVPGALVFLQGPLFQLNTGTNVRFLMGDRGSYQSFDIGIWGRLSNKLEESIHADAIILSMRYDYQNVGFGISYDVNVSELRAASNGNGAFELSAYYKFCGPETRNVYCPKF